ncbi:MAG: GNAT family N-acetyltransferase [Steroidobacteraceae bacterium]
MNSVVTDNVELQRFELKRDGAVAFINYQHVGTLWLLTHAEVPAALRGRGLAAELTAGALELVRARGERVQSGCSYVSDFIARNAQYQDLLSTG